MKKIAITQRLVKNDSYFEIRDTLDLRWGEICRYLGFLPILLPTAYGFKKYFKTFRIDGIILSGGNDLFMISGDKLSMKRDVFEKELIGFGLQNNIPIMGVCRGMQVIADYFNCKIVKVNGHSGTKHRLVVSNDSVFRNELINLEYVNSFHNYGVKTLPEGFLLSAVGEEGGIEAFEHINKRIFAQMWHSERENPFNDHEIKIIHKFFEG